MTVLLGDASGERAMKKKDHTNRFKNNWIHGKSKTILEFLKQAGFETLFLLFISVGIVISGILVSPASIGIGMCLVLLGTIVFSEV